MSLTSKVFLGVSSAISIGIISYVHIKQFIDKQTLHEGVLRDEERQRMRRHENIYQLHQQNELTKQLLSQQNQEENHQS